MEQKQEPQQVMDDAAPTTENYDSYTKQETHLAVGFLRTPAPSLPVQMPHCAHMESDAISAAFVVALELPSDSQHPRQQTTSGADIRATRRHSSSDCQSTREHSSSPLVP